MLESKHFSDIDMMEEAVLDDTTCNLFNNLWRWKEIYHCGDTSLLDDMKEIGAIYCSNSSDGW